MSASKNAGTHKCARPFSPLIFLAALGAGGISVIPFAFLQYTTEHGKGLVQRADVVMAEFTMTGQLLQISLEVVMLAFIAIHLLMTIASSKQLWHFYRSPDFADFFRDPLRNSALMAPFISIVMTMNVLIGPVRYFIPRFADNLQLCMAPALGFWLLIYVSLMVTVMRLLKRAFIERFDFDRISFGWLLHPFALGMLTVTGTGFAALAESATIAHTAAFLSVVSGSMGLFLLGIKLFAVFHRYFTNEGLGEKAGLPSFLIVIPNITLYAISLFRFGHYLEHHQGMQLEAYFTLVITGAFAFETWYMLFGLMLLSDFFKKDYFQKEYYVTQWGLICPFVAYAVLASFTFATFLSAPIFSALSLAFMAIAVVFYIDLLARHWRCQLGIMPTGFRCPQ